MFIPLSASHQPHVAQMRRQRAGVLRGSGPAQRLCSLLLLSLEAGYEHLLGPLGSLQVVLQHTAEEIYELLVALRLSVLDVGLQGLHVILGLVEHGNEVIVFVLGLPRCFGHGSSFYALGIITALSRTPIG